MNDSCHEGFSVVVGVGAGVGTGVTVVSIGGRLFVSVVIIIDGWSRRRRFRKRSLMLPPSISSARPSVQAKLV